MNKNTITKLTILPSRQEVSEALFYKTVEEIEDTLNSVGVTIFEYRSFRGIKDSTMRSLKDVLLDLSKVWPTLKESNKNI